MQEEALTHVDGPTGTSGVGDWDIVLEDKELGSDGEDSDSDDGMPEECLGTTGGTTSRIRWIHSTTIQNLLPAQGSLVPLTQSCSARCLRMVSEPIWATNTKSTSGSSSSCLFSHKSKTGSTTVAPGVPGMTSTMTSCKDNMHSPLTTTTRAPLPTGTKLEEGTIRQS